MSSVLETALAEVSKLPPVEQDVLATLLLDEMKSEQRWRQSFAESQAVLKSLAAQALDEHRTEKSKPLDETL